MLIAVYERLWSRLTEHQHAVSSHDSQGLWTGSTEVQGIVEHGEVLVLRYVLTDRVRLLDWSSKLQLIVLLETQSCRGRWWCCGILDPADSDGPFCITSPD